MLGFLTSGHREIADPLASVKAVSAWLRGLPAQDVIGRQQVIAGKYGTANSTRNYVLYVSSGNRLVVSLVNGAGGGVTKQTQNAEGGRPSDLAGAAR